MINYLKLQVSALIFDNFRSEANYLRNSTSRSSQVDVFIGIYVWDGGYNIIMYPFIMGWGQIKFRFVEIVVFDLRL